MSDSCSWEWQLERGLTIEEETTVEEAETLDENELKSPFSTKAEDIKVIDMIELTFQPSLAKKISGLEHPI